MKRMKWIAVVLLGGVGAVNLIGCARPSPEQSTTSPGLDETASNPVTSAQPEVGLKAGEAGETGEALCELCGKPLVEKQEVRVTDEATQEEHRYRCIHCAIVALQRQFPHARAEARSGLTAQPIALTRNGGTWRSEPAEAVLLVLPEEAGECLTRHQIFADREEFQSYLDDHPELPAEVAAYDLSDVEAIIRSGFPPEEEPAAVPEAAAQVTLPLSGLHCDGCAARVAAALQAVPGVYRAQVTVETAEVAYDPEQVDVEILKEAVRETKPMMAAGQRYEVIE